MVSKAENVCSDEYFCDNCGHYPLVPVHGHFVCPACKMPTKCCEGAPAAIQEDSESEQ
jgi:hypothetical protein